MQRVRFLLDGARTAAENMALDTTLLEDVAHGRAPQTLRIYGWSEPSYTIGYFQDETRFKKNGLPVVKRPTGGGSVLHGKDLTFALVLNTPNSWLGEDVKGSYLKINQALLDGLRELYPALDFADCRQAPGPKAQRERICFEDPSCYDLMLGSRKVVGSSQRRVRGALLHQCSIFLEGDRERIVQLLREGFERELSFFS